MVNLQNKLDKAFYVTQQKLLQYPLDNIQNVARYFLPIKTKIKPEKEEIEKLKLRFEELLSHDIKNVEDNLYPRELLFQIPFLSYLSLLPLLILEAPKMLFRLKNNKFKELPVNIGLEKYPAYFQRNFHWQTDGYFSYHSAKIYDLAVELLFIGAADIMRRQIIPPISKYLNEISHKENITSSNEALNQSREIKLLDVACGTGRVLKQLARAQPEIKIYGIDLSPFYIEYARDLLKDIPTISLFNENAENIPFKDEYFDIITSVYLFHELPPDIRKKVLREMYRVLKPGGLVVIEDSAQLSESSDIENVLYRFATEFHEPFYREYLRNDLAEIIKEAGFIDIKTERHFVAKTVVARK